MPLILKVEFPAGSALQSKLMKFKEFQSVKETIDEITKANKLQDSSHYLLYKPATPTTSAVWMEPTQPLTNYNLKLKDPIFLKKKFQLIPTTALVKSSVTTMTALIDFTVPLVKWMPYLCQKFHVPSESESNFGLFVHGGKIALDLEKTMVDLGVPAETTLVLRDKTAPFDDAMLERNKSKFVMLDGDRLELQAPAKSIKSPDYAGHLIKQNRKKKWEKRYFILKHKHLLYYRSVSESKPAGVIPLVEFRLRVVDAKKLHFEIYSEATNSGAKHNNYQIRAEDDASYVAWTNVLHDKGGMPNPTSAASASSPRGSNSITPKAAPPKKIFGAMLATAVTSSDPVPAIVRKTIRYIDEKAITVTGIFRLSGRANTIADYKAAFDRGEDVSFDAEQDCHNITGVLKLYLRELAEPILTFDLYFDFLAADASSDTTLRVKYTKYLIDILPRPNRETLKFLMSFLKRVTSHSAENNMPLHNVATVFGPNLLKAQNEDVLQMVEATAQVNSIVNTLIQYYDEIFENKEIKEIADDSDEEAKKQVPKGQCKKGTSAKALYDFVGKNPNELSFNKGDIIIVLHKSNDGWWRGELDGKFGKFPGSYVGLLSAESIMRAQRKKQYMGRLNDIAKSQEEEQKALQLLKERKAQLEKDLASFKDKGKDLTGSFEEVKVTLQKAFGTGEVAQQLCSFYQRAWQYQQNSGELKKLKAAFAEEIEILNKALQSMGPCKDKGSKKPTKGGKAANYDQLKVAIDSFKSKLNVEDSARRALSTHKADILWNIHELHALLRKALGQSSELLEAPPMIPSGESRDFLALAIAATGSNASNSSSSSHGNDTHSPRFAEDNKKQELADGKKMKDSPRSAAEDKKAKEQRKKDEKAEKEKEKAEKEKEKAEKEKEKSEKKKQKSEKKTKKET